MSIEDLFDKHVNKRWWIKWKERNLKVAICIYTMVIHIIWLKEQVYCRMYKIYSGISLNVDDIINQWYRLKNKYLNDKEDTDKIKDFEVKSENEQFEDYDIIESYYKNVSNRRSFSANRYSILGTIFNESKHQLKIIDTNSFIGQGMVALIWWIKFVVH